MWIFLNGKFVKKEQARISVFDHGFLYGDGVYETLRVYQRRIFLLERHLARLRRSCELIGLVLPIQDNAWASIMTEMLIRNRLQDAGLRVTISRGEGELGIDPGLCPSPTIVVMAKSVVSYPAHMREQGVRLQLVSVRRNPESAQSPQIKSLSFLNNILAKQEAVQAGAFDALMLNMDGHVTECTTSNIFFVSNHRLHTPSVACGILEGITREVVMILARELGIKVEEGAYGAADVLQADECFMTNTGLEIMAVSQIGRNPIGQGGSGEITMALWRAFQENLERWLGPVVTGPQGS
ncbi:aminotransferase class IV [Candidatus Nitrospira allomarina]|uniref:branched-chain-amino-acid transaminase n=1 Tax=Candidatus Nitrospira allomarina TaxID=3020900 RepID=A0AA96JX05_9BACT|nr:aminotransferase class IV [Candidatus Nitrospira allomarina]WNM58516.1 aminotransferase class IV [Candidatus Nitrospira allomarina]